MDIIIDYVGVITVSLMKLWRSISALEKIFEEDELFNAVADMTEVIRQLPSHHAAVWDYFQGV